MGDCGPDIPPESPNPDDRPPDRSPDCPPDQSPGSKLDPARLAPADAARALTVAGKVRVTEAMIRADIDAGAPVNPDGTINLVRYAAWQVREKARSERSGDED